MLLFKYFSFTYFQILEFKMSSSKSKTPYLDALEISLSDLVNPDKEIKRLENSSFTVGLIREIYTSFQNKYTCKEIVTFLRRLVPEIYKSNFISENANT